METNTASKESELKPTAVLCSQLGLLGRVAPRMGSRGTVLPPFSPVDA